MQEFLVEGTDGEAIDGSVKYTEPKMDEILVVDDDEAVCYGLTELLKDVGYRAAYVTNGFEAMDMVLKGRYKLVFMDIIMSGLNGVDTYRAIRSHVGSERPKCVIITGYFPEAQKVIKEGVCEGMVDEFIRKPFLARDILDVVKKYF